MREAYAERLAVKLEAILERSAAVRSALPEEAERHILRYLERVTQGTGPGCKTAGELVPVLRDLFTAPKGKFHE